MLFERTTTAGMVWVCWPKKASKMPTDLDENKVRDLGLELGFVDVKVAAIDGTWSGLKFVTEAAGPVRFSAPTTGPQRLHGLPGQPLPGLRALGRGDRPDEVLPVEGREALEGGRGLGVGRQCVA